jgi:hypothetical protein
MQRAKFKFWGRSPRTDGASSDACKQQLAAVPLPSGLVVVRVVVIVIGFL